MDNLRASLLIGLFTFLTAVLVTLISQARINKVSLPAAAVILLLIIFIGIISDMVGIASAVAEEKNFNARAAKKIFGSRQALFLIKHADRVSTVMCDIVGDICGTIGGATGMAIVIRIVQTYQGVETLIRLLFIGLIAALTVGGKAFFKHYGIRKADEIIFFSGKMLAGLDLLRRTIVTRLRGVQNKCFLIISTLLKI